MLVCIEVNSDSGSGLTSEVGYIRRLIGKSIYDLKIYRLIVTQEEYKLLDGLSRGLGVEQKEETDVMCIYGIPVIKENQQ